ncbi:MAG TPA: amino acid ABC transporter substrate-binding protein [Dissulfurispiraceae bacterium]
MKFRGFAAAFLLFSIAALSLIPSAIPGISSREITIGMTLGLSGKYHEMADMVMKGARLWEKETNRSGGILGKKVRLLIYDDKSNPENARTLYERLIEKDKVDLVFGPYSSELKEAILPITEKHGYPVLTASPADSLWDKGYKYLFGISMPAQNISAGFLEMLARNDIGSIAVVCANDATSRSIASGVKTWAGRFGQKVLLFEEYNDGKGLEEAVKKAKASRAQALIFCGYFDDSVTARRVQKKLGWSPRAFFAPIGPALGAFHAVLREDADFVFSSSTWEHHGGLMAPGCMEFHNAFLREYREEPSYHAAEAYAMGQLLQTAIKDARSFDREKIRDTLSLMDAMSILGRYGVDTRGMQLKHFNLVIQWQNGRREVVWPKELGTAKPVFQ